MQDSRLTLHGHVVRTISYAYLKECSRNKISAEIYFPFIRKAFYSLNYHGQKKKHTVSRGNTTHWYHKNSALLKCLEVCSQCTYNRVIITMVMRFNWLKTVGICLINAKSYSLFLETEKPAAQGNLFCDNLWKQGTWE